MPIQINREWKDEIVCQSSYNQLIFPRLYANFYHAPAQARAFYGPHYPNAPTFDMVASHNNPGKFDEKYVVRVIAYRKPGSFCQYDTLMVSWTSNPDDVLHILRDMLSTLQALLTDKASKSPARESRKVSTAADDAIKSLPVYHARNLMCPGNRARYFGQCLRHDRSTTGLLEFD